jgi:hypothetical protein
MSIAARPGMVLSPHEDALRLGFHCSYPLATTALAHDEQPQAGPPRP